MKASVTHVEQINVPKKDPQTLVPGFSLTFNSRFLNVSFAIGSAVVFFATLLPLVWKSSRPSPKAAAPSVLSRSNDTETKPHAEAMNDTAWYDFDNFQNGVNCKGRFAVQVGGEWQESRIAPEGCPVLDLRFKEIGRSDGWITLYNVDKDFFVRLPEGRSGMAATAKTATGPWKNLREVVFNKGALGISLK